MGLGLKNGQMGLSIKGVGMMEKQMVLANCICKMEIITKDNLKKVERMDREL